MAMPSVPRFLRLVQLFLLLAVGPVLVQAEPLKVMTFNLRGGTGGFDPIDSWIYLQFIPPDTLTIGPSRKDRAIATIQSDMPDILGVQELKFNMRNDLIDAFPEYSYYGLGREGEQNGDSNGIYYRHDRFDLLDAGDFWLSETPEVPGTTFIGNGSDVNNPRMATWVKLHDGQTNQDYFVLNTHWSLDSSARTQSGALIQSMLDELSGGLPILLLGDLNTTQTSTAYRTLRGLTGTPDVSLADAFIDGGGVNGRTFHNYGGGVSGSRIDHILYSGEPFEPIDARILRNTYDGGLYPSDHYPVAVTFNVVPEVHGAMLLSVGLILVVLVRRRLRSRQVTD